MQTTIRIVIAIAGWLLLISLYMNGTIALFSSKRTPAAYDQMILLFRRSSDTNLPAAVMTNYANFESRGPINQEASPPGFTHTFSVRSQDYALVPANWPKLTDAELRDMEKQLEGEYQTSRYKLGTAPEGALAVDMEYDDGRHPRSELIKYTTDGQRVLSYSESQTNFIGLIVMSIVWFAFFLLIAPFVFRGKTEHTKY